MKKIDGVLWLAAWLLLIAGFVANHYLMGVSGAILAVGWILLVCAIVGLLLPTARGRALCEYAKQARGEMRKVVWPARQEVTQVTLVVVGMVCVMALLLWVVDSGLMGSIAWLTGQRG